MQTVQMVPVPKELRDGGEQVVVVDTLAVECERKVPEEREAVEVVSELGGRVALEAAAQPERLDLDAMTKDF